MTVFDHAEFDSHEQVVFCRDAAADLFAIIAVHSTTLGPAAGGCRMWPYKSYDEALTDVLRLSKAMSYKNAMAGLALGGGKAVIIGDPRTAKNAQLLYAFGRCVQQLGGRYWTAEDVGTTLHDIHLIGETCDYVFGTTVSPSRFTARGVVEGMRAAVLHKLGATSLEGLTVAVQGVGSVGRHLCELLHAAGAQLIVADINEIATREMAKRFAARIVDPDAIYSQEADVFAPCALGGILNDRTIPQLKARIVAGSANNQLAAPHHGDLLRSRGIIYAPDYVVNAGGILSASRDIFHDRDEARLSAQIAAIFNTTLHICEVAGAENQSTHAVADELARQKIAAARAAHHEPIVA